VHRSATVVPASTTLPHVFVTFQIYFLTVIENVGVDALHKPRIIMCNSLVFLSGHLGVLFLHNRPGSMSTLL